MLTNDKLFVVYTLWSRNGTHFPLAHCQLILQQKNDAFSKNGESGCRMCHQKCLLKEIIQYTSGKMEHCYICMPGSHSAVCIRQTETKRKRCRRLRPGSWEQPPTVSKGMEKHGQLWAIDWMAGVGEEREKTRRYQDCNHRKVKRI